MDVEHARQPQVEPQDSLSQALSLVPTATLPADCETEFGSFLFHLPCTRKGRAAPQTLRLTGDDKLARNPSSKSRSATARSARLYSSRLVSPFPDTGQANHLPTDLRQPSQLPCSGPRNPQTSGCGLLSPAREPRKLCVSRSLGICLYRCLHQIVQRIRRHWEPYDPTMPKIQSSAEDSILSATRPSRVPSHASGRALVKRLSIHFSPMRLSLT